MDRWDKTTAILSLLLVPFLLFFWFVRQSSSGFQYNRIANLNYEMPAGDLLLTFESFPFSGSFLGAISTITGLPLVDVNYMPLIIGVGLLSIYSFSRLLYSKPLVVLLSFSLTFFVLFRQPSYSQYWIAAAVYPLFLMMFYSYIKSGRTEYSFLTVSLFATVYFFGPPIATWGVGLALLLYFWIKLSHLYPQLGPENSTSLVIPTGIAFATGIIFLFFDVKLWEQLPSRLIAGLFATEAEYAEYAPSSSSQIVLRLTNISWFVLVTTPVILGYIYLTLKYKSFVKKRPTKELFLLAVLAGASAEFIVYSILRGLSLRSIMMLTPFAAAYYVHKVTTKKATIGFGVLLLSLSLIFAGFAIVDVDRPTTDHAASAGAANFAYDNGNQVTTDHYSYGYLRYGISTTGEDPTKYGFTRYDTDIYEFVIKGGEPPDEMETVLVINRDSVEEPLYMGSGWTAYEPLSNNNISINDNVYVNKPYESNSYKIFRLRKGIDE